MDGLEYNTGGTEQFPSVSINNGETIGVLYITKGSGKLTIGPKFNIKIIFAVGGGAGGSIHGNPGLGGKLRSSFIVNGYTLLRGNPTLEVKITVGSGGDAESPGSPSSVDLPFANSNMIADGGTVSTSNTPSSEFSAKKIEFSARYYGEGGGGGNNTNVPSNGGGASGGGKGGSGIVIILYGIIN